MKTSPESDTQRTDELIRKIQGGDLSAFRGLMEAYQQFAYAVAFRLLRDEDDAKDAVSEAFVRVWKHLRTYRPEVKFTTWVYKIVINLCYDKMKMESRRSNALALLFGSGDVSGGNDVQSDIENADLCDHVLREAQSLPPKERLVFHLRDVEDLSIAEIAELAGMSVASVKTNLCYARRRIRLALARIQEARS